jgi:hypothetical protein
MRKYQVRGLSAWWMRPEKTAASTAIPAPKLADRAAAPRHARADRHG